MNTCNIIYYGLKVVNQPLLFFSQSYILFTSEPDFLDFKEPSYVDGGKIFFLSFLKLWDSLSTENDMSSLREGGIPTGNPCVGLAGLVV